MLGCYEREISGNGCSTWTHPELPVSLVITSHCIIFQTSTHKQLVFSSWADVICASTSKCVEVFLQTSVAIVRNSKCILLELLHCAVRDKTFFVLISYMGMQNCQERSISIRLTFYCHVPGHHAAKSMITVGNQVRLWHPPCGGSWLLLTAFPGQTQNFCCFLSILCSCLPVVLPCHSMFLKSANINDTDINEQLF